VPVALVATVALGTWLRMAVTWMDRDAAFLNDSAFHWRMISETVSQGHVPALDRLSEPPAGRDVRAYLPEGMYQAAASFHRALGGRDLRWSVLLFVALAGGLIALPVFGGARALGAGPWTGLAAAVFAVFVPAHVHRTYAYWLRYDALGTLLLMVHVALALRALSGARRVWLHSAISALALSLALACWRVALLLPLVEMAFVFVWMALRGAGPALRAWLTAQCAAMLLAGVTLGYLRADQFLTSPSALVLVCMTAATWIRFPRYPEGSISARGGIMLAAVFLGATLSRVFAHQGVVGEQLGIVPARALAMFGFHAVTTPMLDLQLTVQEMEPASPLALLGPGFLSLSAPWFFASPVLAWLAAGRPGWRKVRQMSDALALFVALGAGALVATLLFDRNKVLLGPLAAMAFGVLLAQWLRKPGALRRTLAVVLGLCMAATAFDGTTLAFSRTPDPDRDEMAVLAWLAAHTPGNAVVLAPWEVGYELQTYAGRAAVTDGLLESRENGARIEALARASFDSAPDSLLALAHRDHASYLIVPPSDHLYALAWVANVPFRDKLVRGVPLDPAESQGVMTQMMVLGRSYPRIEKQFEQGSWRVYAVRD
jgi:asparagine N-glycosylation enzyme membrane subunit Stt3